MSAKWQRIIFWCVVVPIVVFIGWLGVYVAAWFALKLMVAVY